MITPEEILLLSTYSKSELIRALILGEWAARSKDAYIRSKLTMHAAEEIGHAAYLTQALAELGSLPADVCDESGDQYYARAGRPKNEVEVLAMTEAF